MERTKAFAAETQDASTAALSRSFAVVSGLGHTYVSEQPKRLAGIDPRLGSVQLSTIPAHRGERPSTEHRARGIHKHVTHITSSASPLVGAA